MILPKSKKKKFKSNIKLKKSRTLVICIMNKNSKDTSTGLKTSIEILSVNPTIFFVVNLLIEMQSS
jgi:hypothetical protein